MDVWHGIKRHKVNPLMRIRKEVEEYHLRKDIEAAKKEKCIYTEVVNFK